MCVCVCVCVHVQKFPIYNIFLHCAVFENEAKYPGIIISEDEIRDTVTVAGKVIGSEEDHGISISIPENAIEAEESLDVVIQPIFSGSFQLPENMEAVSSAYLIKPAKKLKFRKDVKLTMKHYASLHTEAPQGSFTPPIVNIGVPSFSIGNFTLTANGLPLMCWPSTLMCSWCLPLMMGW